MMATRNVFVTGGTGYLGRPLIAQLMARGHSLDSFRTSRWLARSCLLSSIPRRAYALSAFQKAVWLTLHSPAVLRFNFQERYMMRRSVLAMFVVAAAACAPNPSAAPGSMSASAPDAASVRTAIEAANARFVEAFKRSDKAGLVANYMDDGLVMTPNQPAWRGKEAIDRGFTGVLAEMSLKDGGATTSDVIVAGDMAIETGTFAWTFATKAGAEVKDKGKYVTIWKRQPGGAWKILRDINNTDLPAAM